MRPCLKRLDQGVLRRLLGERQAPRTENAREGRYDVRELMAEGEAFHHRGRGEYGGRIHQALPRCPPRTLCEAIRSDTRRHVLDFAHFDAAEIEMRTGVGDLDRLVVRG